MFCPWVIKESLCSEIQERHDNGESGDVSCNWRISLVNSAVRPWTFGGQQHAPKFIFYVCTYSEDWWTDPEEIFGGKIIVFLGSYKNRNLATYLPNMRGHQTFTELSFSAGFLRLCPHHSFETLFVGKNKVCRCGHWSLHLSGFPSFPASVSVSSAGMQRALQTSLLSRLFMSHACSLA